MQSALNISKYLLSKVNVERFEEIGDGISNLKIQKLLFYIQKTYFSVYEKKIFSDDAEAWRYGPVIPEVYHCFKKYGSNNIDIIEQKPFITSREPMSFEKLLVIDFVWDEYSKYSAGTLVDLTHRDEAWLQNYIPNINNTIPLQDLKDESLKNKFLAYKSSLEEISEMKI